MKENVNGFEKSVGCNEINKIMLDVIIALIPVVIASTYYNGFKTLIILAVTIGFSVLTEYLFNISVKREQTLCNLSAVVTGIIIGLMLPTGITYLIPAVGAVFATLFGKMLFGGLGGNFINPSLIATAFLANAYITKMIFDNKVANFNSLLIGGKSGLFVQASLIPIILGFIYLVIRKRIKLEIPVLIIISMLASTFLIGTKPESVYLNNMIYFIAVYCATDPVTSPNSTVKRIVYAIMIGIAGTVFTKIGHNLYGFVYATLLGNIFTPFINSFGVQNSTGEGER